MNLIQKFKAIAGLPTFPVLLALCATHCFNDMLQSVITAVYPMIKLDLGLNFAEIGLITLVYQIAASVFQPVVGLVFDKHPVASSLRISTVCTASGLAVLAFANSLPWILVAVFVVGMGSATIHPEASRITSLASEGRRGMAQSVFQVGGNFGGSIGPLLVALIVSPYSRHCILFFLIISACAIMVQRPIIRWYRAYLQQRKVEAGVKATKLPMPLPLGTTIFAISILMILIFSKYIYMASITSYYTFFLIKKFGVSISASQICLFVFLISTAAGTLVGGPMGDKYGRKPVIWVSILGTAPFSLILPHVGLAPTIVLSFCAGFMLSSAFPAILLYSQELLPNHLGMVSGLFFGFAFGVGGIASAVLGDFADTYGIEAIYRFCAYMPLLGLITCFLPNLKKLQKVA